MTEIVLKIKDVILLYVHIVRLIIIIIINRSIKMKEEILKSLRF